MAISVVVHQLRPPEVHAVLWEKTSDTAEIATWCGGSVISGSNNTQMQIPDTVDGDEGFLAVMPCYIYKTDGRFLPMSVEEFTRFYTKKVV